MKKVLTTEQVYIISDLVRMQTMLYCLRQIIKKNSEEYITATEYDTVAKILVTWEGRAYQKIKILEKAEG